MPAKVTLTVIRGKLQGQQFVFIRSTRALRHPNVVRLHEDGYSHGTFC